MKKMAPVAAPPLDLPVFSNRDTSILLTGEVSLLVSIGRHHGEEARSAAARAASDNTPMTIGEIATAVAKRKTKDANKKRAIKTPQREQGKKGKKNA